MGDKADDAAQAIADYNEKVNKKKKKAEKPPHVPKLDIEKRHKVILFGRIYEGEDEDEQTLYQFLHARSDGLQTEGWIPVGFLSMLPVEDEFLFLAVRKSPMGPEFQVSHKTEKQVICDWDLNPDNMWANVVSNFDKKDMFSEKTLDYLDADPFVLFGIDDYVTQRALRKLEKQPVLLCRGNKPDSHEWFAYLEIDPIEDADLGWVVQSFAEAELPAPWTSYKGIGSIVCFLNHKTSQTTWKHPFYDYFVQLKDFAAGATHDEVAQARLNRLVWGYEIQGPMGSLQEPLISPEFVEQIADIMSYDLLAEPFLVRQIKAYLKVFSHNYRNSEDVGISAVHDLEAAVELARNKSKMINKTWASLRNLDDENATDEAEIVERLADGKVSCIECNAIALSYCPQCQDYYCLPCYAKLHQKGARRVHTPYKLDVCMSCKTLAAKVACGWTQKLFCLECYSMKHLPTLPWEAREKEPRKLLFKKATSRAIVPAGQQGANATEEIWDDNASDHSLDSIMTSDWVPFFDAKGVQFYYNFGTGERMRRSPRSSTLVSEAPSTKQTPREGLQMNMESEQVQEAGLMDIVDREESRKESKGLGAKQKKKRPLEPREIRAPFRDHPSGK